MIQKKKIKHETIHIVPLYSPYVPNAKMFKSFQYAAFSEFSN